MNTRYEFEEALYASSLDSASKAIMAYLGFKKNWKNDGKVWASSETIAKATGLSVRTVKYKVPELKESGCLIDTGLRKNNGVGRPCVVYDIGATIAPNVPAVEGFSATAAPKFSATDEQLGANGEGNKVQNRHELGATIAHEQVRNQYKEQVREQVITTTAADAPVVPLSSFKEVSSEDTSALTLDESSSFDVTTEPSGEVPPKRHSWCDTKFLELLDENIKEETDERKIAHARQYVLENHRDWHSNRSWNLEVIFAGMKEAGIGLAW